MVDVRHGFVNKVPQPLRTHSVEHGIENVEHETNLHVSIGEDAAKGQAGMAREHVILDGRRQESDKVSALVIEH